MYFARLVAGTGGIERVFCLEGTAHQVQSMSRALTKRGRIRSGDFSGRIWLFVEKRASLRRRENSRGEKRAPGQGSVRDETWSMRCSAAFTWWCCRRLSPLQGIRDGRTKADLIVMPRLFTCAGPCACRRAHDRLIGGEYTGVHVHFRAIDGLRQPKYSGISVLSVIRGTLSIPWERMPGDIKEDGHG